MDYRTLRLEVSPPIARITLARPDTGNRIDGRTLDELVAATEAIGDRDDVHLVLMAGEGADFCSGWDDATYAELQASGNRLDPFGCVVALSVPVLAVLHGAVSGAGLELALACDVRVAAENARFSLPEVALGRIPIAGGSARLPRIAGRTTAAAMLLLGDELDAGAAYRAGLVSRVFPPERLASEVEALAVRITANGPIALRYAKEAIRNGIELPLDQALRYELDLSVILQTTGDRAEGVRAFLEKRDPKFENR